jgi:glycosyltransferase involved in cell wall biosynthesis
MLEAMAAGLPVLATNVGDANYLLADSRGVLVAPLDVQALSAGMDVLMGQPERRRALGAAAQAFVASEYAPGPWIEKINHVYCQARSRNAQQVGAGL